MMSKNLCAKRRPTNRPYEVWKGMFRMEGWAWHVLKKYQTPEKEKNNPYARWFCLVISPIVPDGEMGDVYVKDITSCATKVKEDYDG